MDLTCAALSAIYPYSRLVSARCFQWSISSCVEAGIQASGQLSRVAGRTSSLRPSLSGWTLTFLFPRSGNRPFSNWLRVVRDRPAPGDSIAKGVRLPAGTEFRANYKGQTWISFLLI